MTGGHWFGSSIAHRVGRFVRSASTETVDRVDVGSAGVAVNEPLVPAPAIIDTLRSVRSQPMPSGAFSGADPDFDVRDPLENRAAVLAARQRPMAERLALALSWNMLASQMRSGLAEAMRQTTHASDRTG